MTTDEQLQDIRRSIDGLSRSLSITNYLVMMIFIIVVVGPILKQFGLWNLLGIGE